MTSAGERRWTARCPAHDDSTPSLSVREKPGGQLLLHCHAGCAADDVTGAIDADLGDLFPDDHSTNGGGFNVVAEYPYTDEDGGLLFQVVRLSPKGFRQRRPDGRGGWTWKLGDVERVLYRLPDVRAAVAGKGLVAVVEGERDADRLAAAGIFATTCPGGAGKWREAYAEALAGARIVAVLPDNDDAGRKHAEAVARSVRKVVPSVRVVELPGLPEKGDVSDWLAMGGDAGELLRIVRDTPDWTPEPPARTLPPPVSVRELARLVAEEPPEEWLVAGLVSTDSNVLLAGYPKSGKTMLVEELAVALASGTPFLGRFAVAEPKRVGLVLMEDGKRPTKRRLKRLCAARGIDYDDLEGRLHVWIRPPLSLGDETVEELGDYAADFDLDLLWVDSWAYVASGNSDRADEVTPQLLNLSAAREKRPGLVTALTHHARKGRADSDPDALRLTDIIRNSSAFGAWYDAGIVLSRRNETAPIKVRTELRDAPPLDPFAVVIEDEVPGDPEAGVKPSGWLRVSATDEDPAATERREAAARLAPRIVAALEEQGGEVESIAALGRVLGVNTLEVKPALLAMRDRGEVQMEDPRPGVACPISLPKKASGTGTTYSPITNLLEK